MDIDTGSGDELCQAFSSTTVLVKRCPPPQPVCPNVVVNCPDNVVLGEPVTFTSSVTGGTSTTAPVYNWTVSAGTIMDGQGTSSIRVDTKGTRRADTDCDAFNGRLRSRVFAFLSDPVSGSGRVRKI